MPIPVVKPKRVQQQHSLSMSISNLVGKETTADFETRGDHHASNIIMDFPHTPVAPTVDTEDSSPDAVSHAILSSSPAEANHAELSVGDNNVAGTTTTAKHKHRKDKAGSSSKIRRRRHHEGERQEGESNSRRREHHNEEGEGQGGEQAITSRKHHRSGQSHRHYRSHRRHEEEDSQGAHPVSTNEDDGTSAASKSINLHHDEDNNLNNNNNNNTPKIAAHNIRNDLFPPIHGLIPRQQDTLANNHQPHEQQQSHLAAVGGGTAAKKQAFRPSSVYVATASNVQPSIQEETTLTTEWKEGLVPFEESPHHHQQQHHHHYSNNSNINNNLRPSATLRSPGAVSQDVISDANNYMSRGAGGGISQQLQQPTPTQHADSKLAINTTNNGNVFPSSLKQNRPDGSGGELSLRQQQQYSERDLISKQQQVRYNSSNGGVALLGGKKVSKSSLVSDNASERGISMNPATRKSTITANEALTAIKNVLKPPPPSNINPYSGKIKENGLTRRMLGNRQVMLWYAEDVELFDIIKNWKTVYPDKTEEQVLSEFGDRSTTGSLDSITKIICRPKGYWDYIMKFSTGDNRHTVRNVFDVCLLRAGLFLEM